MDVLFFFNFITDVMVLNDIIEQAAGRQSRASEHGGNNVFDDLSPLLIEFERK